MICLPQEHRNAQNSLNFFESLGQNQGLIHLVR